jgi:myosin heavy subunit
VLEDENRALWDRVVLLERRAQTSANLISDGGVAAASFAVVQEVAQLRQELQSVIAGEVLSSDASRAALKEIIREAESDAQRERFAQRQQQQEQRAQEQKAKWKEFITSAKLTYAQEQELSRRLEAEEAARKALTQARETGAPFDPDAFRALRDQRRETDRVMTGMLDESQKPQYEQLRREDRGGGGGNRGDRRERNGASEPR